MYSYRANRCLICWWKQLFWGPLFKPIFWPFTKKSVFNNVNLCIVAYIVVVVVVQGQCENYRIDIVGISKTLVFQAVLELREIFKEFEIYHSFWPKTSVAKYLRCGIFLTTVVVHFLQSYSKVRVQERRHFDIITIIENGFYVRLVALERKGLFRTQPILNHFTVYLS